MGCSSYSADTTRTFSASYSKKSRDEIFTSRKLDKDMDPNGLKVRECRDSDVHPTAVPVIVALDETGSMGAIPETLCKGKLGTLIETMIAHNVPDPAVLFVGVGDHISDRAPLQVGQFESGSVELNKWLTTVFLEGGGGGQEMESYLLAWLVAGRHTSTDHFEKRNKKGYLFTIGDERNWEQIDANCLSEMMGYTSAENVSDKQLLDEARRLYEVFHIHINSTGYRDSKTVLGYWKKMLGERCLVLEDPEIVAELIASTVSVMEGANLSSVTSGFDATTASAISSALVAIKPGAVANITKGIEKL